MSLSLTIFTFINAWWVMLFFVLPLGVKPQENRQPHEYAGAPGQVNWGQKIRLTSMLAAIVTLILWLMVHYDVIPLRDMFDTL